MPRGKQIRVCCSCSFSFFLIPFTGCLYDGWDDQRLGWRCQNAPHQVAFICR